MSVATSAIRSANRPRLEQSRSESAEASAEAYFTALPELERLNLNEPAGFMPDSATMPEFYEDAIVFAEFLLAGGLDRDQVQSALSHVSGGTDGIGWKGVPRYVVERTAEAVVGLTHDERVTALTALHVNGTGSLDTAHDDDGIRRYVVTFRD
jgi:hypothetical protein